MKPQTLVRMSTRLAVGLALGLVLAAEGLAQSADSDLGRLFYTPQQRTDLDRKRATNAKEDVPVVVERLVTVNGRVSRSSGKTTTWINGTPQYDTYPGRDPSRVAIVEENGADATVKVGDTLDRTRGEVRPAVEPGGIEINVQPQSSQSHTQ